MQTTLLQTLPKDKNLFTGWIILSLSFLLFCIPLIVTIPKEQNVLFFILHFGAAIVYHSILYFDRDSKVEEHRIHYRLIMLLLLLISAYALNREMDVFAASPTWFSVVLIIVSINYLASAFFNSLPSAIRYFSLFLHGLAFVVFTYLAIYLLPLYLVSIPGLLVFGISIHTFVPLLLLFATVILVRQLTKDHRGWLLFGSGILAAIIVCIGYVISWDNRVHAINKNQTAAMVEGDNKLPLWIQVAQGIDNDAITEKVIKSELIYKVPRWNDNLFWSMPGLNFGEQQQYHDPLVVLGNLFSDQVMLSREDRIKILESQYNARHEALERLWSGEDLRTEQVSTSVKVWPQFHLAYTEKLLTVFNHQSTRGWNNQGEGIYTFHLPEGAVVTSLSLWINGKEEKAILTSKEKATTAYRTIVGYERRDPSVVHWQEGNTVSVRVFPIMAGNSRTFKIGVTAPLRKEGKQLVYDNIWFDGPDAKRADETVKLEVENGVDQWIRQAAFQPAQGKVVTRNGRYQPRWSLAFKDEGVAENAFSFNGFRYSIKPYERQRVTTIITDVYLDINQAWTDDDFKQTWKHIQHKKVWAYLGEMQQVTENNKEELFKALQKQSFSLFPFYLVKNRTNALVISKSGSYSPALANLAGSSFLQNLEEKMSSEDRIKLLHMDTDMSPFIRSLKERRYFDFEAGGPELLVRLLANNIFVKGIENNHEVIVHSADVMITKETGPAMSNAPDHFMRLFAYNHILQSLGKKDTSSANNTLLVQEAQEAYVVSPVSSLVVLETQEDYDRFDIKDSKASLKNASLKNTGAVPEPSEWAIIILLCGTLLLFVVKSKIL